jgi:hypothetical protein
MSGKGYTLIGNKSGVKKWRKNDAMDAAPAAAMTSANIANRGMIPTSVRNPVVQKPRYGKQPTNAEASVNNTAPDAVPPEGSVTEMPAMSVVAAPIPRGNQPFSTRFDVNKGRVVATGGTPDESFERYDAAQERYKQGAQTKEGSAIVNDYIGQDALSRTPEQIAQDKAMDAARGRGGSNWQEMDAARRRASEAQQQQIADEKRAAATAKRNKEIERRMTAVAPPRMR